jgi:epoxyqueuosine reductase
VTKKDRNQLARLINQKAEEFGADLTGIASVEDMKRSPSHRISENIPEFDGVGTEEAHARKRGIVKWPEGAKSAIILAVAHPHDKPEMDWWVTADGSAGNTAGNRLLIKTVTRLSAWLEKEPAIRCFPLPYHIETGGVYMKDAAVLAGLGCIGKNNMLLTPQYGPRVRLRVMLTDADLASAGAADFDPCEGCSAPCRTACPQDAFAEQIYFEKEYGMDKLPGRNGVYNRFRCNRQMVMNESDYSDIGMDDHPKKPKRQIRYCRECEMVCPIG